MAIKAAPFASNNSPVNQVALKHSIRRQWLVLALGLAVLAGVFGYQSYTTYRDVTIQEHYRLQTQARAIASNVEYQLESTNLTLASIIKDMPYLRHHENLQLANRRLQALSDAMPGIRTMMVLDAEGTVVASNREELVGRNFRGRDYFATPAKSNNPETLYMSPPFRTVLGAFLINVSRIIPAADGSFGGVVTAALDPEYFNVLLSSVLYAPDMLSAITHGDGMRFIVVPQQGEPPGSNLAVPGSFYTRHRASGRRESVLTGKSPGYRTERVMALHTVKPQKLHVDKPLYVACSRDLSAVYESWRENTVKQALAFLVISFLAGTGLLYFQRRQRGLALLAEQTQKMTNLRLNLMEYAATHDMQEFLSHALDEVCSACDSPIGFYHFVESDQQTLTLQAWSSRTLEEFCSADPHTRHYPVENAGVWADCIRQKRAVIHNDYLSLSYRKGLPEGHAPVVRELTVPILRAERVMAILGIGNKPDDYTELDAEFVTHLADIVWEITERKRSDEERFKLGLRYKTLQSVSRDGIHILDQDGALVESNAAFRQMLGYGAEDDLSLHVSDWDASISPEKLAAKIRELIHAPAVFETRFRRKDGTISDVEISACGVQLGAEWYLYASARDISRRKEMESSLRESRQFMTDIFDFLPDATFVVDREMTVIAWNRAMEEMSGVAKEQMLGQGDHAYTIPFYGDRRSQLLDLIDVNDEELKAKYQGVARRGECLFAETFCPELNNGKGAHVWAVVAPLYNSDGTRIGAIESIRDITAIKETEANLARSNRELELFAYVASHDLQEPLRKIAGFTELLANRYRGTFDEKAESYMAYIVDGATRMRTLINDLLSYSRVMRSSKELAKIDCSGVLARVVRDMELTVKENDAEIVCGALPVVMADSAQLGQLFQNLISNAIKYRGVAPPRIRIAAVRQRNHWLFSVADNGIGIAPEFFERIFVIFQRLHTRTEHPGTGIGLAVCQKIVERHGGKIWVESTEGTGSTFFFTLPVIPHDREKPA